MIRNFYRYLYNTDRRETYQTRLKVADRIRIFLVFFLLFAASMLSVAQTIEAETGILSGTQTGSGHGGYSGAGYVTGFDAQDDKVTLAVPADKGVYDLYLRYAAPYGDKFNFIYVNGENMGSVPFPGSASFTETKVGKVFLNQGSNTIAIVKDWGYFEVDYLRLESSSPSPIGPVATQVVTPSPNVETDSLYNLLSRIYGKVILSGQYGGATEFDQIKTVSGKTPVIRGFDFIDYSPSRVEHGATSSETENAIDWSHQRGIVTFCWHWNAPKDLIDQPGKEWWRGFYTDATTFDLAVAMNDSTSEEYSLILRDIDSIAVQLKKLQHANVPVLWRPLHEAEGKWFWWGAKGPEPCKWLWKLLFERLVKHHSIHNLIWVWTTTASDDAMNWYPGDAYVDIVGADIYLPAGTYGSNFVAFDNLAASYQGKKIIALSENGPIPGPEKLFSEGAAWSWFCTWSGSFITDGVMNTNVHINQVFNDDYVITLDEIDSIDAIIARLQQRKEEAANAAVTGVEAPAADAFSFVNPVRDNLLILRDASQPFKAAIYDMRGEIIFPEHVSGEDHSLIFDFGEQSTGLYLLRVIQGRSVKVYRIIRL